MAAPSKSALSLLLEGYVGQKDVSYLIVISTYLAWPPPLVRQLLYSF